MKPTKKKLIVLPEAKEEVTSSGIHFVEARSRTQLQGTVISIGGEITEAAVGDVIVYSPLFFEEIEIQGEKHHVIEEPDIHAIID